MEPQFNTSFIPKKSLQADAGGTSSDKFVNRRSVYGPGFYLTLLIFIASVTASIAIFGYTTLVDSTIEKKIRTLEEQKKEFDERDVEMLIQKDNHIKQAKKLLNGHVAFSELFNELETITLKWVQYTEMEYEAEDGKPIQVTFSGNALNYKDVALQTTEYRKDVYLHSPIVQELERVDDGPVLFSITVSADEDLVSFADAIRSGRLEKSVSAPVQVDTIPVPEETTVIESQE